MKSNLVKRIIIDVFESGESKITEQEFIVKNQTNDISNEEDIIRERSKVTYSWSQYGFITYSKKSDLFAELCKMEDTELTVRFLGKDFKGKIDKQVARIFSLRDLMRYAYVNGYPFEEKKDVELEFDKNKKVLTLNLLKS